ncbi:hypothetical protein ACVOMS_25415 [Bradyrhizobium guangxiense]
MMHDVMSGMSWTMGLTASLVLIVLILAAAALIKYLLKGDRRCIVSSLQYPPLS